MKTDSKKLDKNCQVELTVTLDADEVKSVVRDVERTFVREVQIPGFRKGKVPLEIIRRQFADGLRQETERGLLRRYCDDAVKAEKLDRVAVVDARDVKVDAAGGSFTAVVEVKPEFKVPAYKGLKIAPANTKVEESAVVEQIDRIRAMHAKYEDAKEGEAVADGDFAQIDYSGTVGGRPILELAPEAKVVASGTGFWFQVEEGRFLPEILDAVKGMRPGESKEGVKAKFDKESAPEGLKGEKAEYSLTLKAFRRRILPTDAELAEKVKAESFEKFAADVREQMEKHAVASEANRRENDAVEQLLKKADFEVPSYQVQGQVDLFLRHWQQRAEAAGISAEYVQQNSEKILADATENAIRQVRLFYIIDAIAAAEGIDAKAEDRGRKVLDLVLANAKA